LIRNGIVTYDGEILSLKRFQNDVKEVLTGQDCGIGIKNFNDIKVGDLIEAYITTEVEQKF
jgi:translation initiation factor IF-2